MSLWDHRNLLFPLGGGSFGRYYPAEGYLQYITEYKDGAFVDRVGVLDLPEVCDVACLEFTGVAGDAQSVKTGCYIMGGTSIDQTIHFKTGADVQTRCLWAAGGGSASVQKGVMLRLQDGHIQLLTSDGVGTGGTLMFQTTGMQANTEYLVRFQWDGMTGSIPTLTINGADAPYWYGDIIGWEGNSYQPVEFGSALSGTSNFFNGRLYSTYGTLGNYPFSETEGDHAIDISDSPSIGTLVGTTPITRAVETGIPSHNHEHGFCYPRAIQANPVIPLYGSFADITPAFSVADKYNSWMGMCWDEKYSRWAVAAFRGETHSDYQDAYIYYSTDGAGGQSWTSGQIIVAGFNANDGARDTRCYWLDGELYVFATVYMHSEPAGVHGEYRIYKRNALDDFDLISTIGPRFDVSADWDRTGGTIPPVYYKGEWIVCLFESNPVTSQFRPVVYSTQDFITFEYKSQICPADYAGKMNETFLVVSGETIYAISRSEDRLNTVPAGYNYIRYTSCDAVNWEPEGVSTKLYSDYVLYNYPNGFGQCRPETWVADNGTYILGTRGIGNGSTLGVSTDRGLNFGNPMQIQREYVTQYFSFAKEEDSILTYAEGVETLGSQYPDPEYSYLRFCKAYIGDRPIPSRHFNASSLIDSDTQLMWSAENFDGAPIVGPTPTVTGAPTLVDNYYGLPCMYDDGSQANGLVFGVNTDWNFLHDESDFTVAFLSSKEAGSGYSQVLSTFAGSGVTHGMLLREDASHDSINAYIYAGTSAAPLPNGECPRGSVSEREWNTYILSFDSANLTYHLLVDGTEYEPAQNYVAGGTVGDALYPLLLGSRVAGDARYTRRAFISKKYIPQGTSEMTNLLMWMEGE